MEPSANELSERLRSACTLLETTLASGSGDAAPRVPAIGALRQLAGLVGRCQPGDDGAPAPDPRAVSEMAGHGICLLGELHAWTRRVGLAQVRVQLSLSIIGLARWIVHCGGELTALAPVVEALSEQVNASHEPRELAALDDVAVELAEAVDPRTRSDADKSRQDRPWRLLLINRAICATRSHDPARMEAAFETLLRYLPEEGPGFFRDGMEQMDSLDYPQPVRDVMERYFTATGARQLH